MFENFLIWEGDMQAAGVEPCGVLSPTALIVAAACLCLIAFFVYRSRGVPEAQLDRMARVLAIVVTCLELCKIAFNWAHGGWTPNHWLPLSYCSFAIYSYWLLGFGRGRLHEAAKGYIAGGGIVAGCVFLVLPMTSVATYPMVHFLPCYSMFFHSAMMIVGLSYLVNGYFRFDMQGYRKYLSYTIPAVTFSLCVNLLYLLVDPEVEHCNMMFLTGPYNLGEIFPFIQTVYDAVPWFYTLCVYAVYVTLPFFFPYGIAQLVTRVRARRAPQPEQETSEMPDSI